MDIFSQQEQDDIVQAVSLAESHTSGEIRLVIERKVKQGTPYDRAGYYFDKLAMHQTQLHSGILIYLAVDDHAYAVIGDSGIHARVGEDFWNGVSEHMAAHFREGRLVEGIIAGIQEVGEQLGHYFPKGIDDVNELPDDIHFGDN